MAGVRLARIRLPWVGLTGIRLARVGLGVTLGRVARRHLLRILALHGLRVSRRIAHRHLRVAALSGLRITLRRIAWRQSLRVAGRIPWVHRHVARWVTSRKLRFALDGR